MMVTREHSGSLHEPPLLLGESPLVHELRKEIERAGRSLAKVLILGETGVGKEVVARLVHLASTRHSRPFVAVNCSGIPETLLASELFGHTRGSFTGAYRDKAGLVRQADRGTLFLDELGEMSLAMQAMLLRFTETGEIQPVGADAPSGRTDVRLITATNRDLWERVAAGAFRDDLYYRLNVIQIRIPPLRARGTDIVLLLRHYLERAAEMHRLSTPELTRDTEEMLLAYEWPGNVRELRNLAERIVLRDIRRAVTADDLRHELRSSGSTSLAVQPASLVAGSVPENRTASQSRPGCYPSTPTVERVWAELMAGGNFWDVVQRPFRAHELTRSELVALIDRGLQGTRGSYRALVKTFNLPATEYKRFHAFLYQQNANLSVTPYRETLGVRAVRRHGEPRCQAVI